MKTHIARLAKETGVDVEIDGSIISKEKVDELINTTNYKLWEIFLGVLECCNLPNDTNPALADSMKECLLVGLRGLADKIHHITQAHKKEFWQARVDELGFAATYFGYKFSAEGNPYTTSNVNYDIKFVELYMILLGQYNFNHNGAPKKLH